MAERQQKILYGAYKHPWIRSRITHWPQLLAHNLREIHKFAFERLKAIVNGHGRYICRIFTNQIKIPVMRLHFSRKAIKRDFLNHMQISTTFIILPNDTMYKFHNSVEFSLYFNLTSVQDFLELFIGGKRPTTQITLKTRHC